MAAKTSKVRYASRTAVYGSNAYDLSRAGALPLKEPVPHKAPVRKPAAKPKAPPETTPRQHSVQKTHRCYGISLFGVAGFAVVAVLMVFVVLAHIKFTEISAETVSLQSQLEELAEEERVLKITYEDIFDVNEVEAYATNVLGMTKPGQDQIATISSENQDKAVVAENVGDDSQAEESMVTFLASLVAYFKQTP